MKKIGMEKMEWQRLDFNVPITESTSEDGKFLIRGVAINATTTRNNRVFLAEELRKSASSLKNKPILKDHDNSVDSIVGRTTNHVMYNETAKRIDFEGNIIDPSMQEKISQGLINTVSVGAMVEDIEEKGDKFIVRGLEFVELSLVAVPADKGAGFTKAIAEGFRLKSKLDEKEGETQNIIEEDKKMEDDKVDALESKNAELNDSNKELEEKVAAFEAQEAVREAETVKALKEDYIAIAESVNVEAIDTDDVETLKALIENLRGVLKNVEDEADGDDDGDDEGDGDEGEGDEKDSGKEEAKMKGKKTERTEASEELLEGLTFTTEDVETGFGAYSEAIYEHPVFKRD